MLLPALLVQKRLLCWQRTCTQAALAGGDFVIIRSNVLLVCT